MPRIVPIQLLKCLKVLLDDNGGILSAGEVKRLASLMTKYSKKLVSKCIYVQILKCTKTELLGEFMGAGGWSLVYTWLNDAIRAMNWPLVQEILELLLLCPVDVNRLKINSAPKLVKGLCKDGGNEGVRILAKRLVEQWLKVVTENPEATLTNSATTVTTMTPQATSIKSPPVAVVAPMVTPANMPTQTSSLENTSRIASSIHKQTPVQSQTTPKVASKADEEEEEEEAEDVDEDCHDEEEEEQDPLGGVHDTTADSYSLTPAQKKASESGLVYKIVVKNGNQFLAKVPKTTAADAAEPVSAQSSTKQEDEVETTDAVVEENDAEECSVVDNKSTSLADIDDNSSSLDKPEKENNSNSGNEDDSKVKSKSEDAKKSEDKKSTGEDKERSSSGSSKDGRSSKEKERRSSSSSVDKEKERENKSSKSSSSSSGHRSSSHKSSSSKSSSSSTSKSKSSTSSSSHRSSSDKHRSDKERSSSSKDRDRSGSSSSSKHRSYSSKSSSSSSSGSKDKYRDKDKYSSGSSSSSSKNRDRDRESSTQSDKDKNTSTSSSSSSAEKLGKIPKKSKDDSSTSVNNDESANKSTSINIPSKKASMSIEIRKDTEKSKTVKTYKSQFRSHGLTEEAPPPPSRKGLKKPSSGTASASSILPISLPSSLKRTSPPPRDSPIEKKPKIDMNSVAVVNDKPGAIKLIPPKKIQTLVETNIFSDALSAATGPKKVAKRKRSNTPVPTGSTSAGPSPPTSPEVHKVMPLKFYQDTLDESKTEDSKTDKEHEEQEQAPIDKSIDEDPNTDKENDDDDDDIPLKKVKEDIEQKVAQEKKMDLDSNVIDITKDSDEKEDNRPKDTPNDDVSSETISEEVEIKKPGPGCGPNGPPGVLMLHRRKGPKKKLTWRPQESLEQVRFFELDENERVNVTKTSFMDMKNLEHFNERDAIVLARRGFTQEDNMEPQTNWKTLIELDDVPPHPEGNQSKQRKIQAEREMTTLRALYFTHALIPDSPAEAEIEPIFNHDIPLIPLDDLTGNPDAVNDFTSMPWPESRGSPKHGDSSSMAGTGGLGSPVDMFGGPGPQMGGPAPINGGYGASPFSPIISPFSAGQGPNGPPINAMPNNLQGPWQRTPNGMGGSGPMMGNAFNNNHGSPIMDMGGPPRSMGGGPNHMMNNGPPQNFNNQFGPGNNNNNPFAGPGPMNPFGGPPGNNFGVMGPGGPMVPPHMMNGMGPGPMMCNNGPPMINGPNNRNNGSNWRTGGGPNFQDNNGGGNGGNWRPAGPGRGNGGGGNSNNNGVCKAFMRGHCRVGKSCKFIHPSKGKRI